MKCPACHQREYIQFNSCEGFSQDFRECTTCGCRWTFKNNERIIIAKGDIKNSTHISCFVKDCKSNSSGSCSLNKVTVAFNHLCEDFKEK